MFGTTKDNQDETETRNEVLWDKWEKEPEKQMTTDDASNAQTDEDVSGGFKFSFFGNETVPETTSKPGEFLIYVSLLINRNFSHI